MLVAAIHAMLSGRKLLTGRTFIARRLQQYARRGSKEPATCEYIAITFARRRSNAALVPNDAAPLAFVSRLLRVGAQDVRITSIENSHSRTSEELSAGGAQLNLVSSQQGVPPQPCR